MSLFKKSFFSALIKQVNKSIDGTADDEDEGVPTDQAIRAGLELLKVRVLLEFKEQRGKFSPSFLGVGVAKKFVWFFCKMALVTLSCL